MKSTRIVGRLAGSWALALAPALLATLAYGSSRAQAQAVAPPPPAPAVVAPPPAPVVPAPQGQWVATAQYGYVWVPAGASVVDLSGVPSVYLYTPTYGWAWYASPWGWGPYAYGNWVRGPWPYGFRVWHHGARSWGVHFGPHVYVAPRPHFHHHPFRHHRHRRWGGHRFYR